MTDLADETEAEATRTKLHFLEARYQQLRSQPAEDLHVRELSLLSLKHMIVQLQEELLRFETSAVVSAIENGLRDSDAGRTIPVEEVRAQFGLPP